MSFMVDKLIDELDDFLERMDLEGVLYKVVEAILEDDWDRAVDEIAEFTNGNLEGEKARDFLEEMWEEMGDILEEMYEIGELYNPEE